MTKVKPEKQQVISVRISPELRGRLDKFAADHPGVDPNKYARDMVGAALSKEGY